MSLSLLFLQRYLQSILFLIVGFFSMLFLTGCQQGPGSADIQQTIEQKLAQRFGQNTFTVTSFERRGSNANHSAEETETRRTVYFSVVLTLNRDMNFGDWGSNDVAALTTILGTGKRGIKGLQTRGNRAGDSIRAQGTAVFSFINDQWQYVASAVVETPPKEADQPFAGTVATETTAQGLERFLGTLPKEVQTRGSDVIDQELRLAQARILGRLAQSEQKIALASGPSTGEYYTLARAIQRLAGGQVGTDIRPADITKEVAQVQGADNPMLEFPRWIPVATGGGTDNLRLLREGVVTVALAQADTAKDAFLGEGAFVEEGAFSSLRQVAELYPEYIHVFVRADSDVTSLEQLTGKVVQMGPVGSASYHTGKNILEAAGIQPLRIENASIGYSLEALENGSVDAILYVVGLPAATFHQSFLQQKVRLLSLPPSVIDKMAHAGRGFQLGMIAPHSYPNQVDAITTLTVPSGLYVRANLAEGLIRQILQDVVLSSHDFAAAGAISGSYIRQATARHHEAVPIHPVAERILQEK